MLVTSYYKNEDEKLLAKKNECFIYFTNLHYYSKSSKNTLYFPKEHLFLAIINFQWGQIQVICTILIESPFLTNHGYIWMPSVFSI